MTGSGIEEFDFRLLILDFGLRRPSRRDNQSPFEAILTEVGIKGKSLVEFVMVNQGKTGAINKAKVFVIVSNENRLGRPFNRFANMKCFDPALVKTPHEIDGRLVTDFGANQSIGFGEDKIRR